MRPLVRIFFGAVTVGVVIAIAVNSTWTEVTSQPFRLVPVAVSAMLFLLASRPSDLAAPPRGGGRDGTDGPGPAGDRSPLDDTGPTLEGAVALDPPTARSAASAVGVPVEGGPTIGRAEADTTDEA